jgi:hypothetical protein
MTIPTVARTGPRYIPTEIFIEGFAARVRPLLVSQEVKLLTATPWGPHP